MKRNMKLRVVLCILSVCAATVSLSALLVRINRWRFKPLDSKEPVHGIKLEELEPKKSQYLCETYDFRNSVVSPSKFAEDGSDDAVLDRFIASSKKGIHDEGAPYSYVLSAENRTDMVAQDPENPEVLTPLNHHDFKNLYKGNGGMRLGLTNQDSYFKFSVSHTPQPVSKIDFHIAAYSQGSSYDVVTVNLTGGGDYSCSLNQSNPTAILSTEVTDPYFSGFSEPLTIGASSGRFIIYQIDLYFDYFIGYDFKSIKNVPLSNDYSFIDCGSFKYRDVFTNYSHLTINKTTNKLGIYPSHGEIDIWTNEFEAANDILIAENDGSFNGQYDPAAFEYFIMLKSHNWILWEKDEAFVLPLTSGNDVLTEDSEFMIFKKVLN